MDLVQQDHFRTDNQFAIVWMIFEHHKKYKERKKRGQVGNRGYRYSNSSRYRSSRRNTRGPVYYPRKKFHFASSRPATGKRVFIFDPNQLAYAAYNSQGRLIKSGPASGGASYCHDVKRPCKTPVGRFTVYAKGPENCRSKKYPLGKGGAWMPHCMFFRGGYAIHGSNDVANFNASHGCVRVHPRDAQWMYHNFIRVGTTVIVRPYYRR